MGWAIGQGSDGRDIGYGVPALCDHPLCNEKINRGLSFVCGMINTEGEDRGCGLHFCTKHLNHSPKFGQLCERCWPKKRKPFERKPDLFEWQLHKYTHPSWADWRKENGIETPEGYGLRNFAQLKEFLEMLHAAVGKRGLISAVWDGDVMTIALSRPDTAQVPYGMRFTDGENDFDPDNMAGLIAAFVTASDEYFGKVIDHE